MHVRDNSDFRVLVVDDERTIADTLALILNRSGFSARAAYSGDAAVLLALEWRPTALISDVVMPGMNGIDAAAQILRFLPECEVILFSGHGTVGISQLTGLGSFEVLPKPVHPARLIERLNALRGSNAMPRLGPDFDANGLRE